MKKVILTSMILSALTGCADLQPMDFQQSTLKPANQIVIQPTVIPTQPTQANYRLAYGDNPALMRAYQQYIKTGKAPNVVTDGFVQFAYGSTQPVIQTNPLELTVVTLEPSENVTNVSSGDPTRWSYSMAYSGQGKARQAHIMIKPSQADIATDIVITTDKRMYTLKMVSNNSGKYIRDVRFWYPDELQSFWDNYNAQQSQQQTEPDAIAKLPNINLSQVNFDYSISGSFFNSPSWKPTRVFDDGTHTYIQFPSSISSQDMPALFISNGKDQELVNYRSKPPYFVVDKIFDKAVLILGVGGNQSKVTITNNHYA